jgi:methylenetetrahydrofolate--tRNA-(uracil-5-)-methyltransferase
MTAPREIIIIGGGLAGCEAAWQAAQRDCDVILYEMRPRQSSAAHKTDRLAELVCSNSLGSSLPDRATGQLQNEMEQMGSLLIACARQHAVPAGGALAVDRNAFAAKVTQKLENHPRITIRREEISKIPAPPAILATGPLTSDAMAAELANWTGEEHLFFFDALAPIVRAESINMDVAFRASRYDRGEQEQGDYINCPLNRQEYDHFVRALLAAKRIPLKAFEECMAQGVRAGLAKFFESCLPIEIMAGRGHDALSFGPMRPVGLADPRTGRRPWAVVQLRQDDLAASLYNLVGFQTNLTYPEQQRIFRMIPGLEHAEFERYGQMHRNTFLCAPRLMHPSLQFKDRPDLFAAGQLTGIEGYAGNIASGLVAGINAARMMHEQPLLTWPETTVLGALLHYITTANAEQFQPMKANFGILPTLQERIKGKRQRAAAHAQRAQLALQQFITEHPDTFPTLGKSV